jgi:hypothetical protein
MFTKLNASNFEYNGIFYSKAFEEILSKVIICYDLMISQNVSLPNNENSIRDFMLYNYLKKQWFKEKHGLTNYLFDPELPEDKGRIDIRVIPVNPLINDDAYYIIECKRLNAKNQNGKTGLNAEYIAEGIYRFVSKKYSTYYKANGMIGFIVDTIDIDENITSINTLLNTSFTHANTTRYISKYLIVENFEYSYCSTHIVEEKEITVYHLMLNFSRNIQ